MENKRLAAMCAKNGRKVATSGNGVPMKGAQSWHWKKVNRPKLAHSGARD